MLSRRVLQSLELVEPLAGGDVASVNFVDSLPEDPRERLLAERPRDVEEPSPDR